MTDTQSWRPTGTDYPNAPIQVLLGLILNELPPIGKKSRNKEQGYDFRGIDDVMIELNPLLGKYGVVVLPDVVERLQDDSRVAKSGAIGHTVHLHVRFTFQAPDGTTVRCSTWGEGTDYGDKATNKAMTSALKYALFQVFAIADGAADSDNTTPEPDVPVADNERHEHLADTINAAHARGHIPEKDLDALGRRYGKRNWPLPVETMEQAERDVAAIIATAIPAPAADAPAPTPAPDEKPAVSVPAAADADPNVRPADVPTGTMLVGDDWVSYGVATIPHLRAELRRRKLDDGGSKKQDLVDRLAEYDARLVNKEAQ